jgi:alanine racemase
MRPEREDRSGSTAPEAPGARSERAESLASTRHLTTAVIHLDRLAHNLNLLQQAVGRRPLWPCIKANAYGHGAELVARHLVRLGYNTLGVADVPEAIALLDAGLHAKYLILSATLPEHAEAVVAYDCEPVVCTREVVEALGRRAAQAGKRVAVHLKVDTGMGRIGIRPDEVAAFLNYCRAFPAVHVRGLMSHFPRADETDKAYSLAQIERFWRVVEETKDAGIEVRHMANSAAILDLPASHFDAVRPGIAMYGLAPSREIANPRVSELQPVLEWKTRIVFLKEVPEGTGLSYGHIFHTTRPSLIATIPVGYGDGLDRRLSNDLDVLVHGARCPQVGHITMDQSLVDVTALRGRIGLGDEVVLIGRQDGDCLTADAMTERLGTINYEIVTAIAGRVPRVSSPPSDGR